ncbi:MAG: hypothetical protein V4513_08785 [Pseudomonadota bacterium]
MTRFTKYLAAAAVLGAIAAPAAAQYAQPYPQTYPQQYPPNAYPQTYPGYNQGYGQNDGGIIAGVVERLLGNRYNTTDRSAVSQCASAAVNQARVQYRGYGYNQGYGYGQQGYGQQPYAYQQNIAAPSMRVTAITDVRRRSSGLRVSGLLDSGYNRYPQAYAQGYNQPYANATGDLTFRCDVNYRGQVTNVRIKQNSSYRRY